MRMKGAGINGQHSPVRQSGFEALPGQGTEKGQQAITPAQVLKETTKCRYGWRAVTNIEAADIAETEVILETLGQGGEGRYGEQALGNKGTQHSRTGVWRPAWQELDHLEARGEVEVFEENLQLALGLKFLQFLEGK